MLPVLIDNSQRRRQGLTRSGSDFDLLAPFASTSPWQMMRRMQEDMDRLFGQFLEPSGALSPASTGQAAQSWAPHVDVSETEQEYHIEADLPGARQEDIDIQVQNNQLILRAQMRQEEPVQGTQRTTGQSQRSDGQTASGQNGDGPKGAQAAQTGSQTRRYHQRERRFGYFERVMSLPPDVDESNIQAEFQNGVLTLRLPKQQPAASQARRISIAGGESSASSAIANGQAQSMNEKTPTVGAGASNMEAAQTT